MDEFCHRSREVVVRSYSVMKGLVVGTLAKRIILFLSFFYFLAFSSCASLPRIEDYAPLSADNAPKIIGPKGQLSPKKSKAIIERLKGQVEPTDILQRHILLLESISGSPLVTGNKVTLLIDGPATYDAMFKAIRSAKDHINFEIFIIEDDEVGRRFSDLLLQKQAEGVQVNLIYDSAGCLNTPAAFFQRLCDSGIQAIEFNPIDPSKVRGKWLLSQRDHRKILVVDGKVAFTGGINISSVYSKSLSGRFHYGDAQRVFRVQHFWRDTHVQIEGPAVAEFQKLFLETWAREKGPESNGNYFPPLKQEGNDLVRVLGSTPGRMNRITYMMYVSAFTYAENFIHLTSPYFVPDEQIVKALTDAAERGVDVKIILPGAGDSGLVFYAGRSYYTSLLRSGVKLYERRDDAVLHAKTAVIDSIWSTVGSTNMDLWSLLRNDEVNAVILSRDFATEMEAMFDEDLRESNQIHLEEWKRRPLMNHVKEWFTRLLAYWL
jgi:cardiolipin synthase